MGAILNTLTLTNSKRPNQQPPIQRRRNKLLANINTQIEAVKAALDGRRLMINYPKPKHEVTDESIAIITARAVSECWWTGDDGKVYLEIRYGWTALEIAKGKTAVQVGTMDELIPTLDKLKQAAMQGEFDDQLNVIGGRYDKQLVGKKKSAK